MSSIKKTSVGTARKLSKTNFVPHVNGLNNLQLATEIDQIKNSYYDIIVGDNNQRYAGFATYTWEEFEVVVAGGGANPIFSGTLPAMTAGQKVLILDGTHTFTGALNFTLNNITVTKQSPNAILDLDTYTVTFSGNYVDVNIVCDDISAGDFIISGDNGTFKITSNLDDATAINMSGSNALVFLNGSTYVLIGGNLKVLGDAGGNIDIGDEVTDTVSIIGHIDTDINMKSPGNAINIGYDGTTWINANSSINFASDASLAWNESGDKFTLSKGIDINGNVVFGDALTDTITLNGHLITDINIASAGDAINIGYDGTTWVNANSTIKFASDASLAWNESGDKFTLSKGIDINGDTVLGDALTDTITLNGHLITDINIASAGDAINIGYNGSTWTNANSSINFASDASIVWTENATPANENFTINRRLIINDATSSTSKDTGSLIIEGGAGIEENLNVGGSTTFIGIVRSNNVTSSTSKDTGSMVFEGGVGIEENLNLGGYGYFLGGEKKLDTVHTSPQITAISELRDGKLLWVAQS